MHKAISWQQTFGQLILTVVLGFMINIELVEATQTTTVDEFSFAAPEECWIFTKWNEPFKYASDSTNATEKLMAEPEVKAFVDEIVTRIGLMAPAFDAGDDKARTELLHKIGPELANAIFKRSGCLYVESVDMTKDGEPRAVNAAMILNVGENAASLARDIANVMNAKAPPAAPGENPEPTYKVAIESNFSIVITTIGNKLFVATSETAIAEARKRMSAKTVPKWLQNFKSNRGVKHVSNLSYFNVRKIRSKLVRLIDLEQSGVVAALGLNNAETLESCSGLTEEGAFSRLLLTLDGRPEGILDLSAPKGLSDADLAKLPADSMFASGLSLDVRRGFGWLNLVVSIMSGGRENMARMIMEIERETGIHLERDIVNNLGKSWTLYNGAGDGWLSGMTLTTTVRDASALNSAIEKLVKTIMKETRRERYPPVFSREKVGEDTITSVSFRGFPMFVEPSWSITSERLIFALYPQAVESALKFTEDQTADESRLLAESDLKFLRNSFVSDETQSTLLGMTYVDTATNFEISYPYMQIMTSMSRSMVNDFTRGMPEKSANQVAELFSGIRLPRARVVHRHLEPSLLAMRLTDTGLELETRQTIPSLDLGYTAPIAVGALLPAISSTRTAARKARSQNQMRQHILASVNYESAHMHFPAGYTVDKEGQKLLSWRVHILPFIEQNGLYSQFKLDEPWDSPNNIKLIDKMPPIFRSPVSKAKQGMTTYIGIGGDSGVLQPSQPGRTGNIGFSSISDGSSNTIYIVEVSDELAVEWTKPDGGIDPKSFNTEQLFGAFEDGTNIAMCDGSVRFINESIDTSMLKAMMTRAGGEIVRQTSNYNQRRNRRRSGNSSTKPVDPRFRIGQSNTLVLNDMLDEADRIEMANDQLKNNIRQIGLAIFNFESAYQKFPSAFTTDDSGKPLLSWRVHILPFIEQSELYQQFRLDEPWDSEHNKKLISKMPELFSLTPDVGTGMTTLICNGGSEGILRTPTKHGRQSLRGVGFGNITDGSSNTVMLINAGKDFAVEWTKPESFEPTDEDLKKIIATEPIVGIGDGSVIRFNSSLPLAKMKEMLTTNGGEVTNLEGHVKN